MVDAEAEGERSWFQLVDARLGEERWENMRRDWREYQDDSWKKAATRKGQGRGVVMSLRVVVRVDMVLIVLRWVSLRGRSMVLRVGWRWAVVMVLGLGGGMGLGGVGFGGTPDSRVVVRRWRMLIFSGSVGSVEVATSIVVDDRRRSSRMT